MRGWDVSGMRGRGGRPVVRMRLGLRLRAIGMPSELVIAWGMDVCGGGKDVESKGGSCEIAPRGPVIKWVCDIAIAAINGRHDQVNNFLPSSHGRNGSRSAKKKIRKKIQLHGPWPCSVFGPPIQLK